MNVHVGINEINELTTTPNYFQYPAVRGFRLALLMRSFHETRKRGTYTVLLSNEVHKKDTISRILWYSDWLHNTTSAGNSIFVTNHNTTSGGRSIM